MAKSHCQIPNAVEKIFSASHCSVGYMGGSITACVGASNTAETSWRALFVEYLYRNYHPKYHCQVSEVMGAVGACESFAATFLVPRNLIPHKPDLAFIEFCVNDGFSPDKHLCQKGMEGIVRQLLCADHRCDVVLLGAGRRPGSGKAEPDGREDHSLHRAIAEHYDLPFIDAQDYIYRYLAEHDMTWDDVSPAFVKNDDVHVNDLGNRLIFESMRDEFEEQVARFVRGDRAERCAPVPPPMVSDEFQYVQLVDPSKGKDGVTLEGPWQIKPDGLVPWYFDHLLVGQPGAKLTFEFVGTAVAIWGLMYNNGLKVHARLDGENAPGPYLRHFIEFGKGMVIAHELAHGPHVLELTVGEPTIRHNKLGNPTAQIGYFGVACKPDDA